MRLTINRNPITPELTYNGYRLFVSRVGKGWRAMIYAPGSSCALPESPVMLEQISKEKIVAEAKQIVDARHKVLPTLLARAEVAIE